MFTGIVQTQGVIAAVEKKPFGVRLVVDKQGWQPRGATFAPGDSICISGVCLTLVEQQGEKLLFDVIPETLAKTTLGTLEVGHKVNLEPSLTASTPMGGHFVQGHVDGVGEVTAVSERDGEVRITVKPPADMVDYIVPKGSVSIEGVSLTIASVDGPQFDVALIPTTLEITTLGALRVGDKVNLEADILSKTIVHHLRQRGL